MTQAQAADNVQNLLGLTQEEAEELSRLWKSMPKDKPLPDTPEAHEAVFNLLIGMYGEALKELEMH